MTPTLPKFRELQELTPGESSVLVRMLAEIDGLFTPFRMGQESESAWPAVIERRREYLSLGTPCKSSGASTERKSGERMFAALAEKGWLSTTIARGQRYGRFTDLGEAVVRASVATFQLADSIPLVECIEQYVADGHTNDGHVSETALTDSAETKDLLVLEQKLLPALGCGVIDSHCDSEGRVGYRFCGNCPEPVAVPEVGIVEEISAEFDDLFLAAIDARSEWQPSRATDLAIPLSCGCWPARRSTR